MRRLFNTRLITLCCKDINKRSITVETPILGNAFHWCYHAQGPKFLNRDLAYGHIFRKVEPALPAVASISGGTHTYARGEIQHPMLLPGHAWDADGNEYERRRGNHAVERGQANQPALEITVCQPAHGLAIVWLSALRKRFSVASAYELLQSAISNWRPTADLGRKYIYRLLLLFVSLYPFAANAQHTIFPLRISENHRYLEDATGRPFLITGDSAWSLIGDLSREDADKYLADRQRRGFNTLIIGLIEHRFSRNAPRNFYKRAPFEENAAFSKPNDAYFDDADWILQQARDRGFLVLLTPAYMGVNGGAEGWYQEMQAAGPDVLKSYGRYLGERYKKYNNIIWVQGGDFDPPDRTLANALAEGIAETDPDAFQTIHARLDTDVALNWKAASWLNLDTIYTYGDVAAKSLLRYITGPVTPFFLIESIYEGEHNATEQNIRANAYGAILSGACGQIFGNNPIWHFGGPGVFEQPKTWQESLASRGTQSMTHLKAFFDKIAWWTLGPEQGKLLVAPNPLLPGEAIGSLSVDGTLAVIYLSDRRSVALNMASLSPSAQQAHWFDPSSGKFSEAVPKNTDKAGITEFQVPQERNSAGFSDWLLMVTNRN